MWFRHAESLSVCGDSKDTALSMVCRAIAAAPAGPTLSLPEFTWEWRELVWPAYFCPAQGISHLFTLFLLRKSEPHGHPLWSYAPMGATRRAPWFSSQLFRADPGRQENCEVEPRDKEPCSVLPDATKRVTRLRVLGGSQQGPDRS